MSLIVGAQDMPRPIFVRTASRTYALQIDAATDVQTLKAQIFFKTGDNTEKKRLKCLRYNALHSPGLAGIPVEQQTLTHSGRRLVRGLVSDIQQDSTTHVLCRGLGGQQTVTLTVRPRLQKDKWSMYWKESMCTKTECLADMQIEVDMSAAMSDVTLVSSEPYTCVLKQQLSYDSVHGLV